MSPFPDSRPSQDLRGGRYPSLTSLQLLLESVPVLIWQTGPDLCLSCVGGAALQTLGHSGDLLAGRPIEELFVSAASMRSRRAHEAALQGEAGTFEADVNGRDL